MSVTMKEKWGGLDPEESETIKTNMVKARVAAGTIGSNNRKKSGELYGIRYESSTEERFLRSHVTNLGLRNTNPIVAKDFVYKPDFWSETLGCYIEVKSTWTFEVMRGTKKYNSNRECCGTQLQKIKSFCSECAIVICVEVGREFYVLDPMKITELTDVVKDGKLLRLGLDNNVNI